MTSINNSDDKDNLSNDFPPLRHKLSFNKSKDTKTNLNNNYKRRKNSPKKYNKKIKYPPLPYYNKEEKELLINKSKQKNIQNYTKQSKEDLLNEQKKKDKKDMLIISFIIMVFLALGNRIFQKLMTYPMYNYPFFLNIISTFIYIPFSFIYVWPMLKWGNKITKEQTDIPKYTFAVMGALDSLAGFMQIFAVNYITNASMIVLIQQSAIPISMIISKFTLNARYNFSQYFGSFVVVCGIIVVLIPNFLGSGATTTTSTTSTTSSSTSSILGYNNHDSSIYHHNNIFSDLNLYSNNNNNDDILNDNDLINNNITDLYSNETLIKDQEVSSATQEASDTSQIIWSLVIVLSCIPMCLSSVYKEKALGEADIDVVYLNGWVAVFQLLATVPLVIPSAWASDLPVSQIGTNTWDGLLCYVGINSVIESSATQPPDNRGVNMRALDELFHKSHERSDEIRDTINVSILEIYNETIQDLLSDNMSTQSPGLQIRQGEHGMYVPNLTIIPIENMDEVLELVALADENRSITSTDLNEHSSRSHMLLSIYIESENLHTGVITRGKLHLVDLAGSERISKSGATGQALKEAQAINKSLSSLGDVIQSLVNKNSHIPYRNSTLTYLLQDSLSGDSKTLMIVCASPVIYNADETFCSLNFASRVRTVELGQAKKNISSSKSGKNSSRSSSRRK